MYMMHDLREVHSAEDLLAGQAIPDVIDDSDEKIPSLGHDDQRGGKDDDANSSGSGSGALGSDDHLELDYHFNTP